MKKKNEAPVVNTQPTNTEMKPADELQVYYNDAYMREKQRLNSIFGVIEEDQPVIQTERIIEPDMDEYVPIAKYKKVKRKAGWLTFFTIVFAVATVALAVIHFVL